MLIIPGEVVTGALVNAIAVVGRQISKAVAGVRKSDDVATARWFETFRLSGTLPDQPDLSPETQDRLARILNGDEIQAALQELLAVRLTDAPQTDASRARDAIRLALTAAGPDAARFAEALADYYDDQICSLVARLEAKDSPLLAQIRSEAFSARIISALHAIARHTAVLADTERQRTAGQAQAWPRAGDNPAGALRMQPVGLIAGRPLGEVTDPFAVEVHRPVQADNPPGDLPVLPAYVPREHDRTLAEVVQAAAAGSSVIAVLVGGSSTGKTRACWEALGLLRDLAQPWRLWHPIDPSRPGATLRDLPVPAPPKVRHLTSWILRDPATLDESEQASLDGVRAHCPHLDALARHVTAFAKILTGRHGEQLDTWIAEVSADDQPDLRSFITGLKRDYQAVLNGLTLPYSSGKVEGNVNRIKMLKRQSGHASRTRLRSRSNPARPYILDRAADRGLAQRGAATAAATAPSTPTCGPSKPCPARRLPAETITKCGSCANFVMVVTQGGGLRVCAGEGSRPGRTSGV